MLKCKDIIGATPDNKHILVTLEDGRCASIDVDRKIVFIDMLLASFDRHQGYYSNKNFNYMNLVIDILKKPNKIREFTSVESYLEDKSGWDKIKKELGYNY